MHWGEVIQVWSCLDFGFSSLMNNRKLLRTCTLRRFVRFARRYKTRFLDTPTGELPIHSFRARLTSNRQGVSLFRRNPFRFAQPRTTQADSSDSSLLRAAYRRSCITASHCTTVPYGDRLDSSLIQNPFSRFTAAGVPPSGGLPSPISNLKSQISNPQFLPSARTISPPSTNLCYQLVKELTGFPPARIGSIVHYRAPKAKGVAKFFGVPNRRLLVECPKMNDSQRSWARMAMVTAAGNRTAAGNPWTVSGTQAVSHDEETRPSLSLLECAPAAGRIDWVNRCE